jgi:hypothetical protein
VLLSPTKTLFSDLFVLENKIYPSVHDTVIIQTINIISACITIILLSVLEYFLTDVYKNDAQGYARLYYELSEVALKDLRASYEYTLTFSGGYIYQAADEINSSYTEVFDKNGKFSYSAVSRYVTQYLLYS